jgi:RNA polymerase-interacting CarD/CdnL/TRCF family regulator
LDSSEYIGKLVLSSSFGVGTVVSIEDLGMGDRLFLVIESEGQNVKNFVAVEDTHSYRLISNKETIEGIYNTFNDELDLKTFGSKKDRIDYFKTQSKIQDINLIGELLFHLSCLEDRSSAEQSLYAKLKESMSLEYSIIMSKDIEESKEYLDTVLAR